MTTISEQQIEEIVLEILSELGYDTVFGPDIAPDSDNPQRERWDDVLIKSDLIESIKRLNPEISDDNAEEVYRQLRRLNSQNIIENNEVFHKYLIEGFPFEYRDKKGDIKTDNIRLVDYNDPDNNIFKAINQFTIIENKKNRRPDIVIFVNGLPLIIIELKNASSETADLNSAYKQIQTYKKEIPTIFNYNELIILSDGTYAEVGTVTSNKEWFLAWKTIDGESIASPTIPQIDVMAKGLLKKEVLLDVIRYFVVFSDGKRKKKKVLAGYHQYHAANKAIEKTEEAVGDSKKVGIIWHTQGSGKSLTLAFYAGKLQVNEKLKNPTLVMLTDRNDLDDQLFQTFSSISCLRETPVQVNTKEGLKEVLKRASGGIIFSTIQKFDQEIEVLSDRDNIIIAADEAHRSQYGFKAKVDKDTGETKYGFAKYLRDALPNASFIGFTGTPIDFEDRSTINVFGDYIDVYDIERAVDDKRTVRIYYESRLAELKINEENLSELDEEFDEITEGREDSRTIKRKWAQLEKVVGTPSRIEQVAEDIVKHFEKRLEINEGKGMIVCMSRRIAVDLHDAIKKLRPNWYNKDDNKGFMKVIMTGSATDEPEWQEHIRDKRRRRELGDLFKDSQSEFGLAIVVDMWLTGFDVPSLHTLYIDKPMKGHTLMQAIARVNRVYKDKQGGLIVDYMGIAQELKYALSNYTRAGGLGKPTLDQKDAISLMMEKYEIVAQMFHGFDYKEFFNASPRRKMELIPEAMDHILRLDNGKKRYIREVTALSKAYSLAVPSKESEEFRDEIGFFQAIKASIIKNTEISGRKYNELNMESAIKQIMSKAISSKGVIDVFAVAGIDKPEISILSDKFLEDVKGMEHKSLAFEALKKLLNEQIKARFGRNKLKEKKFSEMIEDAIKRYQSKAITSAQVIQELIDIAKQIREDKSKGKELGLTDEEEAFYDALANNQSAIDILGDQMLKKIAIELTDIVKKNASIDWTIKKNVQANLKVQIKRLLKKYGYPPDKQQMAADLVLEQAESFAGVWSYERDHKSKMEILQDIKELLQFKEYLPVYSLKAAAGRFDKSQPTDKIGWMKVENGKLDKNMFIAQIKGNSMRNVIKDGEYGIFRFTDNLPGQGEIALIQHREFTDLETGGAYSIKRYHKYKNKIEFKADTDEPHIAEATSYILNSDNENEYRLIAKFIRVID